jgi:enoyl-[acyl-carrier-protein] reductase (NADH)
MKAYCEAILDIVLRASDQSTDSEEVANVAVYTASLQASATTGAALRVDGGVIETIT